MSNPILFLDCNGVICANKDMYEHGDRYISPEPMKLLNEICEKTSALVVITSMWRFDKDIFAHARLTQGGFTGKFGRPWRTHDHRKCRGDEIAFWLETSRDPETVYAIVDDEKDMLSSQMSRFVQTNAYDGLVREQANVLIAMLLGEI